MRGRNRRVRRYFFPPRSLRSQIPLSPRAYSSAQTPWGAPPESWKIAITTLQWRGLARTEADGYRLLKRYGYPRVPLKDIIREQTRPRRFWSRLKLAWGRFRRIW